MREKAQDWLKIESKFRKITAERLLRPGYLEVLPAVSTEDLMEFWELYSTVKERAKELLLHQDNINRILGLTMPEEE